MRSSIAVVLLTLSAAAFAQPAEPVATPVEQGFLSKLKLTIGLGVYGDAYPVSTVKRSLTGGSRFWLGTRLPGVLALRGVFELGYVTVNPFPGRGSDGIQEGAGLEVALDYFPNLKPFIRFMYDAIVIRLSSIGAAGSDGILLNNGFFVHLGARYGAIELHLGFGRDLSGGFAPGIGFSLNWLH